MRAEVRHAHGGGLRREQFMAWSALMKQMGCDYKGKDAVKDFKHNAKATLKKVRKVYPLLKISDIAGGFYVHPSPPAIPRRAAKRNLVSAAPVTTT